MSDPVDWQLAAATGVRIAPGGPDVSRTQADALVAHLQRAAAGARDPIAAATHLECPDGPAAIVVDRAEWVRTNVDSLQGVVGLLTPKTGAGSGVAARANALQIGVALGWLSGKVLGQYDALPGADRLPRILLVAPNVQSAAQAMGWDDTEQFATWVCLHEETHRVQFGAVEWLHEFVRSSVAAIVADLDVGPRELAERLARSARDSQRGPLLGWAQSPETRALVGRLMALMTLLEGHAEWAMDQTDVIPDVEDLRIALERRRRAGGLLDSIMRRVLGLEAKMAQYREGAAFVREVVDVAGVDGLNLAWSSPEALPDMAELHAPREWLARVAR